MSFSGVFSVPVLSMAPSSRLAAASGGPTVGGGTPIAPAGATGGAGGGAGGPSPGGPGADVAVVGQQGAFVTSASLASFAGSTFAVTTMWKVMGIIVPGWDRLPVIGLILSLLVGFVLFLISETAADRGPVTTRDRLISLFIMLINSLVLFSAAIGAGGVTGMTGHN